MNKLVVYRHPEGISLNPREYILTDDSTDVRKFDTEDEILSLMGVSYLEELENSGIFIDTYESYLQAGEPQGNSNAAVETPSTRYAKALPIQQKLDELMKEASEQGLQIVAHWKTFGGMQSVQLGDEDRLTVSPKI